MNDLLTHATDRVKASGAPLGPAKWATLGLGLSLCAPSIGVVQRYLGNSGTAIYLLAAAAGLLILVRYRETLWRWIARCSDRHIAWMAGLTFGVILAVFLVVYPIANLGQRSGGSDGDDALNIAANELVHGRYPYYLTTYLDNPISPLPGAVLLAVPFVLVGSSAYQNFFWLLMFFLVMRGYLYGSRSALLLLWAIMAFSPGFWYALVTGSDYLANALYILLFSLWLIRAAYRPGRYGVRAFLFAVLLGIGMSSRANFLLLLPLIFAALGRVAGLRAAVRLTVIVTLAFAALTLPFYLFDPRGFSPLHTTDELGRFDVVLPYAGLIIPLLTAVLAILLAVWHLAWPDRTESGMLRETRAHTRTNDVAAAFFRNSALVLAFPVFCGLALYCVGLQRLYFGFATFGIFFLFFGAVPAWRTIFESVSSRPAAGVLIKDLEPTGKVDAPT